jgi:hypothetical protein
MGETVIVQCPWCGESIEVWVEPDSEGTMVQDCDVCCRPCELTIHYDGDTPTLQVTRS